MAQELIKLFPKRSDTYPQPRASDAIHTAIRTALSAIPDVGGTVAELFSLVIAPPILHRRDDFVMDLADDLEHLQKQVSTFKIEKLADNEAFISATVQAIRIATSTHHEMKRQMLRNALLHIALNDGPNPDIQEVFVTAIDLFSPSHVKVLNFMWKGTGQLYAAGHASPTMQFGISKYETAITLVYPELKDQTNFLQLIMTDLKNRGFSTPNRPEDAFTHGPGITTLGIAFLDFVLEPPKT